MPVHDPIEWPSVPDRPACRSCDIELHGAEIALGTHKACIEGELHGKDEEIRTLCEALDKAHALLRVVAGKDGEYRAPVGVHAPVSGIARYLTASFVQKCADWCENEYTPHNAE